jgi:hypothetical protein
MAADILKHLKFYLSGGLPDTLRHERSRKRNAEAQKWEEFFSDDFSAVELDPIMWTVRRPAPTEALPAMQYSPAEEHHLFSDDGHNIQHTGHSLQLLTQEEHAEGLVYSKQFGFMPAVRKFTAGYLSTGDNMKLLYGKVEAKVRFNLPSKNVYHALWLSAGYCLPHINILRLGKRLEFGCFVKKGDKTRQRAVSWWRGVLSQDKSYIVALVWKPDRLEWYINGRQMFAAACTIDVPLFLSFSTGVVGKKPHLSKPSVMEIEWVKIYAPQAN